MKSPASVGPKGPRAPGAEQMVFLFLDVVKRIVAFEVVFLDERGGDDLFHEFLAEVRMRDLDEGANAVLAGAQIAVRKAPLGDDVHYKVLWSGDDAALGQPGDDVGVRLAVVIDIG